MSTDSRQLTIEQILRRSIDPSERKSRGNELSRAAHTRIAHRKDETYKKILDYVRQRGNATSNPQFGTNLALSC